MPDQPPRLKVWVTPEEREMLNHYRDAKKCASKQAFDTPTAATREAIQKMMRSREKAPPLRVYECPVCGKFHLTKRFAPPKHE